ncbi:MAG: hypothetical protein SGJ21_17445 [Alphaproteobacteria bacterium]|nr:hypothetical protein [Alphaproteobacteria bacterium]
MSLDWTLTLGGLVLGGALLALAIRMSGHPRKDSIRERWISWRFVILLAGAVLLVDLVHLVNLMGLETGKAGVGRL